MNYGLSKYKQNKISDNLDRAFDRASADDLIQGFGWYTKANGIVQRLAVEYAYPANTVASVLSALSPRNKWKRNIFDTETVLRAVNDGLTPDDVSVSTFNSNKRKAFRIATDRDQITQDSRKTFAFVQNIAYLDPDYVTIDVWHLRASFTNMIHPKSLTPLRYDQIQEITLNNAHRHRIKGYEYQAIVWGVLRN